jgi:hypothetical protein
LIWTWLRPLTFSIAHLGHPELERVCPTLV